jgi:ATP-dependent Lhr-like helicase
VAAPRAAGSDPLRPAEDWFASRGWLPFEFQREAWRAYLAGQSGLVHAPTGMGKTYSVWIGPLLEACALGERVGRRPQPEPLRLLWITPLRALASDMHAGLRAAAEGLGVNWSIELRTGDTSSSQRARQRERLPSALVTTPESLALLLTYPDMAERFRSLRAVVVDEWHELIGSKRGLQTELALARLRTISPSLRTWGLSATLGNLDQAARVLHGSRHAQAALVRGALPKAIDVETLVPDDIERFPWAGHLGIRLLDRVIERLEAARCSLVFTNTRSQTEIWFQSIIKRRPDWIGRVALHHGSLDRELRGQVESGLKSGSLLAVVCTSSLDLGVDFTEVDQVVQIGSPKGVARLLQRAGRSGHQPGRASRVVCVPTNALELVEFAAARGAIESLQIESRFPVRLALDVLVQHLVGLGCGVLLPPLASASPSATPPAAEAAGASPIGFHAEQALAEVRSTHAFADLTDQHWRWCLDFCVRGGPSLQAYPQYARLVEDPPGSARYRVASNQITRLHRLNVGTISSDVSMTVRLRGGRTLGHVEEGFVAALHAGETFTFAGRLLKLLRIEGTAAIVEPATRKSGRVPSWQGGRMPLSAELSAALRERVSRAADGLFEGAELRAVEPLLRLQQSWSCLPRPSDLLIELTTTRDGHHAFVYPFEGRLVHEGLAALLAFRLAQRQPQTFSLAASDHGLHLCSPTPIEPDEPAWRAALSHDRLTDDLVLALNAAQLARRQFREVARVAGLIIPGYPGAPKRARHVQASADLFFDVFTEFEPGHLLLDQARREVLEKQLELTRMHAALDRLAGMRLVVRRTDRLTPFSFPLWADALREQLSTEAWTDRVGRMLVVLEQQAGSSAPAASHSAPANSPAPRAVTRRRSTRARA